MPRSLRHLIARRWNPAGAVVCALISVAAAWASKEFAGHELLRTQNTTIEVASARILTSRDGADHLLAVRVHAPSSDNCARTTTHLLYRCVGGIDTIDADGHRTCSGEPTYYPLASSLAGSGYHLATRQVLAGKVFSVIMHLPEDMPEGNYEYVQRSLFFCSWLGGLIERHITFETAPRTIWLDQRRE